MEVISILAVLIGVALVIYMKRDSKAIMVKEAMREVSHIRSVEQVDREVADINEEWRRHGILSEKKKIFLDALQARRYELERKPSR